jgi:hypothetical protein
VQVDKITVEFGCCERTITEQDRSFFSFNTDTEPTRPSEMYDDSNSYSNHVVSGVYLKFWRQSFPTCFALIDRFLNQRVFSGDILVANGRPGTHQNEQVIDLQMKQAKDNTSQEKVIRRGFLGVG